MKIGDKVRFLSDVGGGVITGFQGKDIVLVTDDNGFEVPTLKKEVVVIETDNYNIAKKAPKSKTAQAAAEAKGFRAPDKKADAQKMETPADAEEPDDFGEITYRPKPEERRGADKLCLYLAFLPVDIKNVTDTAFEAYFINDCNYYIHFALFSHDGNACQLRHEGEVAPNTKIFLEEFRRDILDEWRRITVQALAFKRDKTFLPKPTLNISLRIDGTKFYKLHTFLKNDFFNEPALVYDIVTNDTPARNFRIDAQELQEAMTTPAAREKTAPARTKGTGHGSTEERDSDGNLKVDLHIEQLMDTVVGMQPKDILDYQLKTFRDAMNAHLKERGCRIVFIHGKGDGVLHRALLRELAYRYPQCRHQDASFREYGYGATLVII